MKNILVVGDLILDGYKEGTVDRISPEAPVPVLNVNNSYYRLGGACNLVANLSGLGYSPYVLGCVGDDKEGRTLLSEVNKIATTFVKIDDFPTTTKTRFCSLGQQILRVDRESIEPKDLFLQLSYLKDKKFDYIIISDYAKGVVTYDLISQLLYNYHDSCFILDPNINNVGIYNRFDELVFDYITPNLKEAEALNLRRNNSLSDIAQSITRLSKEVIITLGKHGMYVLYLSNGEYYFKQFPTISNDSVIDVSGAGDTVVAGFVDGLIMGKTVLESTYYAQSLAQIVVRKKGTYAIKKEDL